MTTYDLTLCDRDGTLVTRIPAAPMLPRFIHITDEYLTMSDTETIPDTVSHVTTFQRVASSVWTDEARNALFCRIVT